MKVCPACGEDNPDKAKFCLECATPLAEATASGRRERRVVSVLFCDLVGFTSRSERADIEDVEQFLHGYHQLLRRELERHGGTVEKFIGDAVMALFGAPTAHEDDPERAVRAALAIQDAVAQLRERDGVDVHVRVGVTTGEVLVSLGANPSAGEGMATGDVVNTAARLQSAASVDGVLVGEATYRATDRVIRYAEAEPVSAKGKAEPVVVWQAIESRSLLPEQARMDDLPLVGRASEVASLVAALGRSGLEPSTQLVTVVGAPGIGKTRLVEELGAHVEDQPRLIRWRRGRSLAYGEGVAFWALGEMVKAESGILESDAVEVTEDKLRDAVAAVVVDEADRAWVVRHLRPLVGLEAATSTGVESGRVENFAAWRRFFEALAEEAPTVLVFEDLHWGDDALLDFIDLLSERAGAVPLLIVCTARPELLERRSGWGGGKANTQTLLLSPLSEEDTARLVAELLDQALLPVDTQQALLERAQGNPLYAQEYVRMLRDQGLLIRDRGGWRLVGEPAGLPDSVQAIIAARLDTLSERERAFIQDASVAGKTAWLGAVCAISNVSSGQADELLYALERKQLLRRARRSSVSGEVEFSFSHALTQEVAYGQIRRSERAEKHERSAEWIDHLAGEREDKAELLAHHYVTALALREQAGEDTAPIADRARSALIEAGHQAQAVNAHPAAARHFAAALDLTPVDAPAHARLLLDYATAAYHSGKVDEAMLRNALAAQEFAGDWHAAAQASLLLADWLDIYEGRAEDAETVDARGYDYAIRDGYTPLASHFAYNQAFRLCSAGRVIDAIPFTEEAMARAEGIGDDAGRALLRMWHGWAQSATGGRDGLHELQNAADDLARQNHVKTSVAYHNLGELFLGLGEFPEARRAHAESARWAERLGISDQIGSVEGKQAEDAYHAGDWDSALNRAMSVINHPAAVVTRDALWVRARIAAARGDFGTAREDSDRGLDGAAGAGSEVRLVGLAVAALVYHASGDSSTTQEMTQGFFKLWPDSDRVVGIPAVALAELASVSDDHAAIHNAATQVPDGSRWQPALIAMAEERYADAASAYAEIGSRPLEAAAYLRGSRQAANAGEAARAADYAERALGFYRKVGATAYISEAQAHVARARSA
jgi:class 3 adenylate cyclase